LDCPPPDAGEEDRVRIIEQYTIRRGPGVLAKFPARSRVVRLEMNHMGDFEALILADIGGEKQFAHVQVFETGQPIPEGSFYLASCAAGGKQWHLFGIEEEEEDDE
jgi:hypothetical protein